MTELDPELGPALPLLVHPFVWYVSQWLVILPRYYSILLSSKSAILSHLIQYETPSEPNHPDTQQSIKDCPSSGYKLVNVNHSVSPTQGNRKYPHLGNQRIIILYHHIYSWQTIKQKVHKIVVVQKLKCLISNWT